MALNARKIKAPKGDRPEVEPLEPGAYPGRLAWVIDLGLQAQRPYKGEEKKPAYEIQTVHELSDEFMKDEEGNDIEDKPRWIWNSFPLFSLESDRAKSTKFYYAHDPNEDHEGDWGKLVGSPVIINIVNNKDKEGKVWENVQGFSSMRPKEAAKAPELKHEPVVFSLDEPDVEVFKSLPEWIQKKIKDGLEFKGSKLDKLLGGKPQKKEEEVEDEIPFEEPEGEDDNW
jgi:hypothetical protein